VQAIDEHGERRDVRVAGERPLTLFVDGREIVTLMTLGAYPEALALGYLRTQRFVESVSEIAEVMVDWGRERVDINTRSGVAGWDEKLKRRTVTTGCGQGTVFSCTLDKLYQKPLPQARLRQSVIYRLSEYLSGDNAIYRKAGAVHGCALCREDEPLLFVENVGRHNAADAIVGTMWLDGSEGGD